MSEPDPTRSIHHTIARVFARRLGGDFPKEAKHGPSVLAWRITAGSADPSALRDYAVVVTGAWTLRAFACFCAMVPLSFLVQPTTGNSGLKWVIAPMASVACFCFAFVPYGWWCHVQALRARRAADTEGWDSDRYRQLRLRALPSNGSVIFQLVVGVACAILLGVAW